MPGPKPGALPAWRPPSKIALRRLFNSLLVSQFALSRNGTGLASEPPARSRYRTPAHQVPSEASSNLLQQSDATKRPARLASVRDLDVIGADFCCQCSVTANLPQLKTKSPARPD